MVSLFYLVKFEVDENDPIQHAQRVGKVANLTIFLGILGIILSVLALTISHGLAQRGYGFGYLTTGLFMIALGYGIRYRSQHCLYASIALFVALSCNFLVRFLIQHTTYLTLRFALCCWVSFRLICVIPSMRVLVATKVFPDKNNRFLKLFLKQKRT
ncbi:MAG: hypothetical protein DCC43_07105 [Candidatus Brocadia sp.]|nr:hypothetical protein [Candidatus Brocadia sp. AMX3]OQY98267.1 MAG: hypothetical protein B6D35_12590 [Candidatus Brocadia sp. UTAMX2]RIK00383.1 MAG: hypothetical protein DCC43_07105 [Candidatus Brocadia sp.]